MGNLYLERCGICGANLFGGGVCPHSKLMNYPPGYCQIHGLPRSCCVCNVLKFNAIIPRKVKSMFLFKFTSKDIQGPVYVAAPNTKEAVKRFFEEHASVNFQVSGGTERVLVG